MTKTDAPQAIARPALTRNAALYLTGIAAAALAAKPLAAGAADMRTARKNGVTVIATVIAKPGSEAALHDLFLSLVEPARAEAGNISYDLVRSTDDPAKFVSIEQWTSASVLQAHLKTAPVVDALAKLGPIVAGPPAIVSYTMVSDPA